MLLGFQRSLCEQQIIRPKTRKKKGKITERRKEKQKGERGKRRRRKREKEIVYWSIANILIVLLQ